MDTHAVLLIPGEGDPYGLLREGPCGTKPPMIDLWRCPEHGLMLMGNYEGGYLCPGCAAEKTYGPALAPVGSALVLRWNGDVQLSGCWIVAATLPWKYGNRPDAAWSTATGSARCATRSTAQRRGPRASSPEENLMSTRDLLDATLSATAQGHTRVRGNSIYFGVRWRWAVDPTTVDAAHPVHAVRYVNATDAAYHCGHRHRTVASAEKCAKSEAKGSGSRDTADAEVRIEAVPEPT